MSDYKVSVYNQSSDLKQLYHALLAYGEDTNFLLWYSCFVSVMMDFGFYIPPAQTMCDSDPLGAWFADLPAHVQVTVENTFRDLLTLILCCKGTGLIADAALCQIIQQHDNSYLHCMTFLCMLATHHCRPNHLCLRSLVSIFFKLADYCLAWNVYTLHWALHGEYLSDHYFMQQFLLHLHLTLASSSCTPMAQAGSHQHVHPWSFVTYLQC